MIIHFPDRNVRLERAAVRGSLPDGEWTLLPSRQTFLVPLALPANVLRRLNPKQLEDLAFDRIPLPQDAAKIWLLIPRLGFIFRRTVTAWAVVAPVSVLSSGFDRIVPEDILLAGATFDKRFSKGGCVAVDAPTCLTVIAVSPKAKTVAVWKHISSASAATELSPSVAGHIKRGSFLLRLNAGGSFESLLNKYGTFVTEDASTFLADRLIALPRIRNATLHPVIVSESALSKDSAASEKAMSLAPSAWPRRFRLALFLLSLLLPFAALETAKARFSRVAERLAGMMSDGYEKRYGAKVPDPLLALRAKSRSIADTARPSAVPVHMWLSTVDRLSAGAASAGLRLDVVSLDLYRVEIRGTSGNLQSIAQWVSSLSSEPALVDAALVESESRLTENRTRFLVRARLKIDSGGKAS